jgi:hypothetical protein
MENKRYAMSFVEKGTDYGIPMAMGRRKGISTEEYRGLN